MGTYASLLTHSTADWLPLKPEWRYRMSLSCFSAVSMGGRLVETSISIVKSHLICYRDRSRSYSLQAVCEENYASFFELCVF